MEHNGTSNYRLAKEINVSQSTVANWKNGVTPLPVYVQKVAEYFGISTAELIEGDKQSDNENE
jgi:transcriptional regulator with XRE-family HTH domain